MHGSTAQATEMAIDIGPPGEDAPEVVRGRGLNRIDALTQPSTQQMRVGGDLGGRQGGISRTSR